MIAGLNLRIEHAGRQFHIQVEDAGEAQACFEVRVHEGGAILWSKQVSYQDVLTRKLPREQREDAIRASMEKVLRTAATAVARGKLP